MTENSNGLLTRAEQLLQARREAIGGLEDATASVDMARANLAAAEKKMSEAVSVAKEAGWTAGELRQLGIPVAAPRQRKSPSRGRQRRPAQGSAPRNPVGESASMDALGS